LLLLAAFIAQLIAAAAPLPLMIALRDATPPPFAAEPPYAADIFAAEFSFAAETLLPCPPPILSPPRRFRSFISRAPLTIFSPDHHAITPFTPLPLAFAVTVFAI